jgi:uncharacterized heparinase superfamily protein
MRHHAVLSRQISAAGRGQVGSRTGNLERGLRLWRTVRWLRLSQVLGRAWSRLYRPSPDLAAAPPARAVQAGWRNCRRSPSITAPNTFRFLNEERQVAASEDWNRPGWPALWLYNAHYFDDLVADGAGDRAHWHRELLQRWVVENPPAHGLGWDSYPTSLRIVNWIKWSWSGNALPPGVGHSLAVQVRWLRRRLEWHLLGNHLWANAKALVFAGAYFQGKEAHAWLEKGLALVDRQIDEQILADGGHFERSPMYHSILLEDLLDLLQLARVAPDVIDPERQRRWARLAESMHRWLWTMTHPDGGIAFFNDAALGIAPDAAALRSYAGSLGLLIASPSPRRIHALADSGYVRLEAGSAVLIADVGEIGPDYLPGHAHADTLSFEMSLGRGRMLVNGGTSVYEAGVERIRQRGTAAHTTLQIDGHDSSEVWSSFRVGRRARPLGVHWEEGGDGALLRAGHDGYRWRPGGPLHHREMLLAARQLRVCDEIRGRIESAIVRYHLHPDWSVHADDEGGGWLQRGAERVRWWTVGRCTATVEESTWHPGFGVSRPARTIVLTMRDDRLVTFFSWE